MVAARPVLGWGGAAGVRGPGLCTLAWNALSLPGPTGSCPGPPRAAESGALRPEENSLHGQMLALAELEPDQCFLNPRASRVRAFRTGASVHSPQDSLGPGTWTSEDKGLRKQLQASHGHIAWPPVRPSGHAGGCTCPADTPWVLPLGWASGFNSGD